MKRRRLSALDIFALAQVLLAGGGVDALQIDNGVVGTPQVLCSEDSITFSVRTQNIFRGNIYVKNQYNTQLCRQDYSTNDYAGASFSVRIGDCGMRRIRQLQPHGMNYMVVFVTNFHPQFVTKIDRAYNVRCFYSQADRTVTSQLDVSMLQTQTLDQTTMLMPNCEYSVRSGTLNGAQVRFAQVGDRLVHVFRCDNPNYGMLVKNCFVNDGSSNSIRVLDSRGCPVFTPVIQGPLQYDNSLNLAYVEIWAYKFPDRAQLYFQCQIQVCNKRDNECIGVTPPNCPRVLKTNFQPSSQIDPGSLDPTRVVGTFGPNPISPVVGSGPAINSGANVDPSYGVQPSNYRASSLQGGGIDYGVNPAAGGSNLLPAPYIRKDEPAPGAAASTDVIAQAVEAARARAIAQRRALEGGEQEEGASRRRRSPIAIDVMRFVGRAGAPSLAGGAASSFDRRLYEDALPTDDSDTLDVASPPVFVADADDDLGARDAASFPFSTQETRSSAGGGGGGLCLSAFGLGLVLSTFALLFVLLCALFFFVLTQMNRRKCTAVDGASSIGSSAPSTTERSSTISLINKWSFGAAVATNEPCKT